jgi:hypothetical protein
VRGHNHPRDKEVYKNTYPTGLHIARVQVRKIWMEYALDLKLNWEDTTIQGI